MSRQDEKIKELEEQLKEANAEEKRYRDLYFQAENRIRIGSIDIPFDEKMKEQLDNYLKGVFREILSKDGVLEENFIRAAMNYKPAFIRIFKPVVKEIIEDLDFSVKFDSERYWISESILPKMVCGIR